MEPTRTYQTFFDTPDRLTNEEILSEILRFKQNSILNQMLEGFPELAVVINNNRQIVAFNSKALEAFRTDDYLSIVGKRVGEAIHCIHSAANEAGCGTSYFCRECGAARAIKKTTEKEILADEECRISVSSNGLVVALDFQVRTLPLLFEGMVYTMFTVRDISSNKRRDALERIFFHDVLNTVSAVKGLSEILPELDSDEDRKEITTSIISSSRQLMHEIKAQSALRSAEDGQLEPDFICTTINRILEGVSELYENNPLYSDKTLTISYPDPPVEITTDIFLTVRSLGNLIKNAFEASSQDEEIKVFSDVLENEIALRVHNDKVIHDNVQLQLFQRSFSTKRHKGHGIGLYSVKLIVQQYLKGRVEFISNAKEGTIFSIYLPKNPMTNF